MDAGKRFIYILFFFTCQVERGFLSLTSRTCPWCGRSDNWPGNQKREFRVVKVIFCSVRDREKEETLDIFISNRRLITDEFPSYAHRWIARFKLYQMSFESNSIGASVRLQNAVESLCVDRWRWPAESLFVQLWPNASSHYLGSKRRNVERLEIYRMVSISLKFTGTVQFKRAKNEILHEKVVLLIKFKWLWIKRIFPIKRRAISQLGRVFMGCRRWGGRQSTRKTAELRSRGAEVAPRANLINRHNSRTVSSHLLTHFSPCYTHKIKKKPGPHLLPFKNRLFKKFHF